MIRSHTPQLFVAVLAVTAIAAAQGQSSSMPPAEPRDQRITVHTVKIVLTGICRAPADLRVVADDFDDELPPRPNQKELIFDTSGRRFNAKKGHVSLRLGPSPAGRTDCHAASEIRRDDPKDPQNWVAEFTFNACNPAHVKEVSISTEPSEQPTNIGYVRELRGVKPSVDCAEGNVLRGPINDVQYKEEKLHLQISPDAPNVKACGVIVNDTVARKYAKPNTDELLVFEKAALAAALSELRGKGKACAAPSLSGPALENDADRLNRTKLTKLYLRTRPQPEPAVK